MRAILNIFRNCVSRRLAHSKMENERKKIIFKQIFKDAIYFRTPRNEWKIQSIEICRYISAECEQKVFTTRRGYSFRFPFLLYFSSVSGNGGIRLSFHWKFVIRTWSHVFRFVWFVSFAFKLMRWWTNSVIRWLITDRVFISGNNDDALFFYSWDFIGWMLSGTVTLLERQSIFGFEPNQQFVLQILRAAVSLVGTVRSMQSCS